MTGTSMAETPVLVSVPMPYTSELQGYKLNLTRTQHRDHALRHVNVCSCMLIRLNLDRNTREFPMHSSAVCAPCSTMQYKVIVQQQ